MLRVCLFSLSALFALLPVVSAQEKKSGRKVALLVGINDYSKTGLGNLKCAEKDATDLREVLLWKLGYDKRNVYLMTKAEGYEAKNDSLFPTGANIRTNLKGLIEDLAPEDSVLIAFSGHGVHLKALKEQGLHFCPSDTNLEKPETLLSLNEIYAQLKDNCKANLKILIMDACRNDPSDGRAASDAKFESVTRPLIPKPEGGTVAFFSCSEGQKAYENEKIGRGFFTDSLIRGLSGEAADKDGEVTIPLLENFLKKDVPTTVKQEKGLGIRQIPERLGELRGLGFLAKVAPKPGEEQEFEISKGVQMKFCWIPAGKATLGSPATEAKRNPDETIHEYETKGFWLGKYEVTQEQWEGVMGNNPSQFKGAKLPVEWVSWDNCQEFLKKCVVKGLKVRLPHEDEWEYACRGGKGNKQPYYWGDTLNGDKANCDGNEPYGTTTKGPNLGKTSIVGSYEKVAPHPWGLCDMSGNVAEWCDNLYSKDSPNRVWRDSGSWSRHAVACRSAARYDGPQKYAYHDLGFRVCLVP